MPIKLKCHGCDEFDISARWRKVISCPPVTDCGCLVHIPLKEVLCDKCAPIRNEVS